MKGEAAMVLKADQERVRTLLTETITLLCKNGLHYQSEFSIEGLIAITVDSHEIFLVSLKETFHVPTTKDKLKIDQQDPAPQVFYVNPSKASDDGRSSDSVEFTDILQVKGSGSSRCSRRSRKSALVLPDLPKQEGVVYTERIDLDHISQSFSRPHCSSMNSSNNLISNVQSVEQKVATKLESYGMLHPDKELEMNFSTPKDLNDRKVMVINSSSVIREEDLLDTKLDVRHIKKELSDEDSESGSRNCITIEPQSPPMAQMDSMFLSKYSPQVLQRTYPTTNTGIYQPSALQTTTMNLSTTPDRTETWPSGRRPARKGGSTGGGKRHTCQMCNKSFTFASALTHHENNIHGRRPHPFKCFICGKGFWNQRSMRGHMTSKHLMQTEFCCPICHKEYAYKVSLRDHMKLYHNMTL